MESKPRRGESDLFAQLLPDTDPAAAPPKREAPRRVKRAEKMESAAPADRPVKEKRSPEAGAETGKPVTSTPVDPVVTAVDTAAQIPTAPISEPVPLRADAALTPVTPPVTPPDAALMPVTPPVTPPDAALMLVTPPVTPPDAALMPVTPPVTPVAQPDAALMPVTPPVTPPDAALILVTPPVTQPDAALTLVTPPVTQPDAASRPVTPPDAGIKPAAAPPLSVAPVADPAVPEAAVPTLAPATVDAPKPVKPVLTTPGSSPVPGKTEAMAADVGEEPAQIAEASLETPPNPRLARLDKAASKITAGPAADKPATDRVDGEAKKPAPPVEAEAKPHKPAASPEGPDPSAAAKTKPHIEIGTPAANPAGANTHSPDIKAAQPLDLATAAIQSAPPSHTAAPASPAPAHAAPPVPVPVPLGGLAVAVAANAHGGNNRFEIRLDPPELGRIDVRLHFDANGHVTSHLIVDRADTLDLLRRDAADLERSLQQAGLKTADHALQFSLRDQSPGTDHDGSERAPAAQVIVADTEPTVDTVMRGYTRAGQGAGVDIRV